MNMVRSRYIWWACSVALLALGFVLLGLVGLGGARRPWFDIPAIPGYRMLQILSSVRFWLIMLLTGTLLGEACFRAFGAGRSQIDPLDESMLEKGLDPERMLEEAAQQREDRGNADPVNRLRDRIEKRRKQAERQSRNMPRPG